MRELYDDTVKGQLLQFTHDVCVIERDTFPNLAAPGSFIWEPADEMHRFQKIGLRAHVSGSLEGHFLVNMVDLELTESMTTYSMSVNRKGRRGFESDTFAKDMLDTFRQTFVEHPHELCLEALKQRLMNKPPTTLLLDLRALNGEDRSFVHSN